MKIFLAGTGLLKKYPDELKKARYILESFYSIQDWQIPYCLSARDFLLDSGAFTFMNAKKVTTDLDDYLNKYIQFIKKYDVKKFVELDVDVVTGYHKVLEYRRKLEEETGKKCVPVWHKSRGIEEFYKMCEEYDYAAVGGIATNELKSEQYEFLPYLIREAHKRNCKLHGLGFTATSYYKKVKFDTADSTTWNVGGKFGNVCHITPSGEMRQVYYSYKNNKRVVEREKLMLYNWNQWCKYQQYMDKEN